MEHADTVRQAAAAGDVGIGQRRDDDDEHPALAWDEAESSLVHAVADRYNVETSQVALCPGAGQAVVQALIAMLRPGDHVVVERPTYEPLFRVPEMLGASVARIDRRIEDGWQLVPERLAKVLTPRTRAVVLTNLHSPSGVACSPRTLAEIAGLAARVGAALLVDEVLLDFAFDLDPAAPCRPACTVADNAISFTIPDSLLHGTITADGAFSVGAWVSCETLLLLRAAPEHKAYVTRRYAIATLIGYVVGPILAWLLASQVSAAHTFVLAANSMWLGQHAVESATGITTQALRLESDVPVVAYQFSPYSSSQVATADASILLPAHAWGTDYLVPSFHNSDGSDSWVSVISLSDDNEVTVEMPQGMTDSTAAGGSIPSLSAGAAHSETIDARQILRVVSPAAGSGDFTGMRVSSTGPVAVFSGSPSMSCMAMWQTPEETRQRKLHEDAPLLRGLSQLTPLPTGLGCELCRDPVVGRAVASTVTDLEGSFALRGTPAGATIPVVVQKGRFRRLYQVPISACQDQQIATDGGKLALPRRRSEGDLPQMAVAAGDHDAIECVLRDLGLDPSEFSGADGAAAVHLYDNQTPGMPTLPGQLALPALLSDRERLLRYHLVFLNCSGTAYSQLLLADPQVRRNLRDYVAAGGRLYATDWSYDFIQQIPELAPFLCFEDGQDCAITTPHGFHAAIAHGGDDAPLQASVDLSSAGGRALAAWLARLPSPVAADKVPITDLLPGWVLIRQIAAAQSLFPSTVWLQSEVRGLRRPLTVTFDYPPQAVCGRVLFSSAHTRDRLPQKVFPSYCPLGGGALVQEQILEFLLFNLSDCVGTIG